MAAKKSFKFSINKFISILLCLVMFFPAIAWAFDPLSFQLGLQTLSFTNQTIEIPQALGTVQEAWQGDERLVIHIQDLHCHYEVQMNIARLLERLAATHRLKLVSVEGASLPINVTKLSTFPLSGIRREVSDYCVRRGQLSGAEYFAALSRKPVWLEGAEDPLLYRSNLKTVKRLLTNEVQGTLLDLRQFFEALKPKLFSSKLLQHDRQVQAYREGRISARQYSQWLGQTARRHGLDLADYPKLKAYLATREAFFSSQVDPEGLFAEFAGLDQRVRAGIYSREVERELDEHVRRLDLAEKLLGIAAEPAEVEQYLHNRAAYRSSRLAEFVHQHDPKGELEVLPEFVRLDSYLHEAEDFYQVAHARSQALAQNVTAQMQKQRQSLAVLVTGGFHTGGVLRELKAQGVSYLSLKPKLTRQDLLNPYYALLQDRATPLEKLLAQDQRMFTLEPYLPTLADPQRIPDEATELSERKRAFARLVDLLFQVKTVVHFYFQKKIGLDLEHRVSDTLATYRARSRTVAVHPGQIRVYPRNILGVPITAPGQQDLLVLAWPDRRREGSLSRDALEIADFGSGRIAVIKPERRAAVEARLQTKQAWPLAGLPLDRTIALFLVWSFLPHASAWLRGAPARLNRRFDSLRARGVRLGELLRTVLPQVDVMQWAGTGLTLPIFTWPWLAHTMQGLEKSSPTPQAKLRFGLIQDTEGIWRVQSLSPVAPDDGALERLLDVMNMKMPPPADVAHRQAEFDLRGIVSRLSLFPNAAEPLALILSSKQVERGNLIPVLELIADFTNAFTPGDQGQAMARLQEMTMGLQCSSEEYTEIMRISSQLLRNCPVEQHVELERRIKNYLRFLNYIGMRSRAVFGYLNVVNQVSQPKSLLLNLHALSQAFLSVRTLETWWDLPPETWFEGILRSVRPEAVSAAILSLRSLVLPLGTSRNKPVSDGWNALAAMQQYYRDISNLSQTPLQEIIALVMIRILLGEEGKPLEAAAVLKTLETVRGIYQQHPVNPHLALLQAQRPFLKSFHFADGGRAINEAGRILRFLFDSVPDASPPGAGDFPREGESRPPDQLPQAEVGALLVGAGLDMNRAIEVRVLGRKVIFTQPGARRKLIVKFQKLDENNARLQYEARVLDWMKRNDPGYGEVEVLSADPAAPGEHRLKLDFTATTFAAAIEKGLAEADRASRGMSGKSLDLDRDHFVAIAYTDLTGSTLEENLGSATAATWDHMQASATALLGQLGILARNGYFYTSLGDLFHTTSSKNRPAYYVSQMLNSSYRYSLGRLTAWPQSVLAINASPQGRLRDVKYLYPSAELARLVAEDTSQDWKSIVTQHEEHPNQLMVFEIVGRYFLIMTLVLGAWQADRHWEGIDWQKDETLKDLARALQQGFTAFMRKWLGTAARGQIASMEQLIDWQAYARNMAYWMSPAHVKDLSMPRGRDQRAAQFPAQALYQLPRERISFGDYRDGSWDPVLGMVGSQDEREYAQKAKALGLVNSDFPIQEFLSLMLPVGLTLAEHALQQTYGTANQMERVMRRGVNSIAFWAGLALTGEWGRALRWGRRGLAVEIPALSLAAIGTGLVGTPLALAGLAGFLFLFTLAHWALQRLAAVRHRPLGNVRLPRFGLGVFFRQLAALGGYLAIALLMPAFNLNPLNWPVAAVTALAVLSHLAFDRELFQGPHGMLRSWSVLPHISAWLQTWRGNKTWPEYWDDILAQPKREFIRKYVFHPVRYFQEHAPYWRSLEGQLRWGVFLPLLFGFSIMYAAGAAALLAPVYAAYTGLGLGGVKFPMTSVILLSPLAAALGFLGVHAVYNALFPWASASLSHGASPAPLLPPGIHMSTFLTALDHWMQRGSQQIFQDYWEGIFSILEDETAPEVLRLAVQNAHLTRLSGMHGNEFVLLTQGLSNVLSRAEGLNAQLALPILGAMAVRLQMAEGREFTSLSLWLANMLSNIRGLGADAVAPLLQAMRERLQTATGAEGTHVARGLANALKNAEGLSAELIAPVLRVMLERLPNAQGEELEFLARGMGNALERASDLGADMAPWLMRAMAERLHTATKEEIHELVLGLTIGLQKVPGLQAEVKELALTALEKRLEDAPAEAQSLIAGLVIGLAKSQSLSKGTASRIVASIITRLKAAPPREQMSISRGLAGGLAEVSGLDTEAALPLLTVLPELMQSPWGVQSQNLLHEWQLILKKTTGLSVNQIAPALRVLEVQLRDAPGAEYLRLVNDLAAAKMQGEDAALINLLIAALEKRIQGDQEGQLEDLVNQLLDYLDEADRASPGVAVRIAQAVAQRLQAESTDARALVARGLWSHGLRHVSALSAKVGVPLIRAQRARFSRASGEAAEYLAKGMLISLAKTQNLAADEVNLIVSTLTERLQAAHADDLQYLVKGVMTGLGYAEELDAQAAGRIVAAVIRRLKKGSADESELVSLVVAEGLAAARVLNAKTVAAPILMAMAHWLPNASGKTKDNLAQGLADGLRHLRGLDGKDPAIILTAMSKALKNAPATVRVKLSAGLADGLGTLTSVNASDTGPVLTAMAERLRAAQDAEAAHLARGVALGLQNIKGLSADVAGPVMSVMAEHLEKAPESMLENLSRGLAAGFQEVKGFDARVAIPIMQAMVETFSHAAKEARRDLARAIISGLGNTEGLDPKTAGLIAARDWESFGLICFAVKELVRQYPSSLTTPLESLERALSRQPTLLEMAYYFAQQEETGHTLDRIVKSHEGFFQGLEWLRQNRPADQQETAAEIMRFLLDKKMILDPMVLQRLTLDRLQALPSGLSVKEFILLRGCPESLPANKQWNYHLLQSEITGARIWPELFLRRFQEGAALFGVKEMLHFAGHRRDPTMLEDAEEADGEGGHGSLFAAVKKTMAGLTAKQRLKFINNVFLQVPADRSTDDNGMDSIGQFRLLCRMLNQESRDGKNWHDALARFDYGNNQDNALRDEVLDSAFDKWRNFKRLRGMLHLKKVPQLRRAISGLDDGTEDGRKLWAYLDALLRHPGMTNFTAFEQFVWALTEDKPDFFERPDSDSSEALHGMIQAGNYFDFPWMADLRPRELARALILGQLDEAQVFRPMVLDYYPELGFENELDLRPPLELLEILRKNTAIDQKSLITSLREIVAQALPEAENDRRKKAALIKVQEWLATGNGQFSGAPPKAMDSENLRGLFRFDRLLEKGLQIRTIRYRLRIIPKSEPQAALTGNEAPGCMGFGTGKAISYLFNPNCGFFSLSREVTGADGGKQERILATSVLTLDRRVPHPVKPFLASLKSMRPEGLRKLNLYQELGEAFWDNVSREAVIAADNVEAAPESWFKGGYQTFENEVRKGYQKFFEAYVLRHPTTRQGRPVARDRIVVGFGYADFMKSLPIQEPNHYLPQVPVAYSDKTDGIVGIVPLRVAEGSASPVQGVRPLRAEDALEVAYLESRTYGKNSYRNHLFGIACELTAAAYNEAIYGADRKNLSVGFYQAGRLKGYAIAYAGCNQQGREAVYISDLAIAKEYRNTAAAARMIAQLFKSIQEQARHRASKGLDTPVIFEARNGAEGSYRFFRVTGEERRAMTDSEAKRIEASRAMRLTRWGLTVIKEGPPTDERVSMEMLVTPVELKPAQGAKPAAAAAGETGKDPAQLPSVMRRGVNSIAFWAGLALTGEWGRALRWGRRGLAVEIPALSLAAIGTGLVGTPLALAGLAGFLFLFTLAHWALQRLAAVRHRPLGNVRLPRFGLGVFFRQLAAFAGYLASALLIPAFNLNPLSWLVVAAVTSAVLSHLVFDRELFGRFPEKQGVLYRRAGRPRVYPRANLFAYKKRLAQDRENIRLASPGSEDRLIPREKRAEDRNEILQAAAGRPLFNLQTAWMRVVRFALQPDLQLKPGLRSFHFFGGAVRLLLLGALQIFLSLPTNTRAHDVAFSWAQQALLLPDALSGRHFDTLQVTVRPLAERGNFWQRLLRGELLGAYALLQGSLVIYLPDALAGQSSAGGLGQALYELCLWSQAMRFHHAALAEPGDSQAGQEGWQRRLQLRFLGALLSMGRFLPLVTRAAWHGFWISRDPQLYLNASLKKTPDSPLGQSLRQPDHILRRAYVNLSAHPGPAEARIFQSWVMIYLKEQYQSAAALQAGGRGDLAEAEVAALRRSVLTFNQLLASHPWFAARRLGSMPLTGSVTVPLYYSPLMRPRWLGEYRKFLRFLGAQPGPAQPGMRRRPPRQSAQAA